MTSYNFELIKPDELKVAQSEIDILFSQFKERVGGIDFSFMGSGMINVYMIVNTDPENLEGLFDLAGNKYVFLKNLPQNLGTDSPFHAKKSTLIVRLKNMAINIPTIHNIVFVFDFGDTNMSRGGAENNVSNSFSMKTSGIFGKKTPSTDGNAKTQQFIAVSPKYMLKNVIMAQSMHDSIGDSLSILRNRKKIYEDWGFNEIDVQPKAILSFFGPSGTGKTMCAHAIAHEMECKILAVNYAEIESKWAGESPKNLINAFKVAEEEKAILFFDEADSFLGKRITNVTSGHDQSINSLRSQMLILLENFEGIVIFATNLVKNYDKAFETRILCHIKFELPDDNARALIFEKTIPSKLPLEIPFSTDDFLHLAEKSNGFSGRDIRNVVLDTLALAAKEDVECINVDHFVAAIEKRKVAYEKLKAESDEALIKKQLIESLVDKSKKQLASACLDIAVHAAWADGVMHPNESRLICETAGFLNLDVPDISSSENLRSLEEVAEAFVDNSHKNQALDIACRMVAIDGDIAEDEVVFVRKLYDIFGYKEERFMDVVEYLECLASNNCRWEQLLTNLASDGAKQ